MRKFCPVIPFLSNTSPYLLHSPQSFVGAVYSCFLSISKARLSIHVRRAQIPMQVANKESGSKSQAVCGRLSVNELFFRPHAVSGQSAEGLLATRLSDLVSRSAGDFFTSGLFRHKQLRHKRKCYIMIQSRNSVDGRLRRAHWNLRRKTLSTTGTVSLPVEATTAREIYSGRKPAAIERISKASSPLSRMHSRLNDWTH